MRTFFQKFASVADFLLLRVLSWICAAMLALMVFFIVYTVAMRSASLDPPFWGDSLATFANVWMVMFAFAFAVRKRSNIAMEALHMVIPPRAARFLTRFWTVLFGAVGVLLVGPGYQVASRILGTYWEFGNMPKSYPMMILPVTGILVVVAAVLALAESLRSPHKGPKNMGN